MTKEQLAAKREARKCFDLTDYERNFLNWIAKTSLSENFPISKDGYPSDPRTGHGYAALPNCDLKKVIMTLHKDRDFIRLRQGSQFGVFQLTDRGRKALNQPF